MKRLRLVAVFVLCGAGSLARAQQGQRVLVVRDDDGTPDEGRGHVSGPPHVARKTLHR